MVIERKEKKSTAGDCSGISNLMPSPNPARIFFFVLQGRDCRDGDVHLLSTTGPTGRCGTSRVIQVIYLVQRTEELKCIYNINNSNRFIFLYGGKMCAAVLQKGERELRVQPALPVPVDLIKVSVEWKVRWPAAITGPQWGLF